MAARHGHLDCSAETFIARCEQCPSFRGTPQATKAWAAADLANHRRREHPKQAAAAARQARRRDLRMAG